MKPINLSMRICLLMLSLSVLSGCGGNKMSNFEPAPDVTIFPVVGETIRFSVEGPDPTQENVSYTWRVLKSNHQGTSEEVVAEDVLEYDYVVSAEDEQYPVIAVSVVAVVTYGLYPLLDYDIWELKVGTEGQVAPEWEGDFVLTNNNDADLLEGFNAISGDLLVSNSNFTSLTSLASISNLGGQLSIVENKVLRSLQGLDLTSVPEDVTISSNAVLTSLQGLEALTSIGESLRIKYNPRLKALLGLELLSSVGEDFEISVNEALCASEAQSLADQVMAAGGIAGEVDLSGNKNCE